MVRKLSLIVAVISLAGLTAASNAAAAGLGDQQVAKGLLGPRVG